MLAKPIPAVLVYCDNTSVLLKVNSRKDNQKSLRHIRRRLDSCRHVRETGVITVDYIESERNLADPFTKGLAQKPICRRFETRGVPGPTSKLSPRAPAQMGRLEAEREGGRAAGGRQAWEVEPAAFVLAPRPGRVRLQ
jgi:hypothetical protein